MKFIVLFFSVCTYISAATLSDQIKTVSGTLFADTSLTKNKSVAVLPFESTEKTADGDLGIAIAEFLITDIVSNNMGTVVDRSRIAALLEEQNFSNSEMADQNKVIEMGRMMSANFIITGKVLKAMGSYLVTAQMINTETSQIVSASKVTLPVVATDQAIKELYTPENYVVGSTFRSLLIPGWGQSFAEKPTHGVLFGTLCGVGIIGSVATGIVQGKAHRDYTAYHDYMWTPEMIRDRDAYMVQNSVTTADANAHFESEAGDKFSSYTGKKRLFAITTIATGTLWTINVVDAFILGKKAEKKVRLYFSANPITENLSAKLALSF